MLGYKIAAFKFRLQHFECIFIKKILGNSLQFFSTLSIKLNETGLEKSIKVTGV